MQVRFYVGGPANCSDTRIVTRSSEVSCVEPTPSMVLRSRTREAVVPPLSWIVCIVEIRQETDTRPEPEIDNPAEIQVSMSAIYEGGSGDTRPDIPEIVSE